MDYLQYLTTMLTVGVGELNFKPCYKWITFNTKENWIINLVQFAYFKPCYKWITFNTQEREIIEGKIKVAILNLVINGLPSIQRNGLSLMGAFFYAILNLVINGLPSIHLWKLLTKLVKL